MSQLDFFVFSTQLFWFIVVFSVSYFFLVKYFLPKIFYIVRFRGWLLKTVRSNVRFTLVEVFFFKKSFTNFLIFSFRSVISVLKSINNNFVCLKDKINL